MAAIVMIACRIYKSIQHIIQHDIHRNVQEGRKSEPYGKIFLDILPFGPIIYGRKKVVRKHTISYQLFSTKSDCAPV
jgi:hypothetical protein